MTSKEKLSLCTQTFFSNGKLDDQRPPLSSIANRLPDIGELKCEYTVCAELDEIMTSVRTRSDETFRPLMVFDVLSLIKNRARDSCHRSELTLGHEGQRLSRNSGVQSGWKAISSSLICMQSK